MKFSHFFIDRPRFAGVIAILITLVGALSYLGLPVAQYPEIAPPTVIVRAAYPGASPQVIAETVAAPLEQEINGVEHMLYMTSSSTNDGVMTLTITFELGTNLDIAQVQVQNRVAIAESKLPEDVRRLGIVTQKSSPDLMLAVHLLSPDDSLDQLYISNYALLRIRDVLARINGVGQIFIFGAQEYSMRVWLDAERMAARGISAGEVVTALRNQNAQLAGGALGEPPIAADNAFQVTLTGRGRLVTPGEFAAVIVKSAPDGRLTRVGDIARVELGAVDYRTSSFLDGRPAVAMAMFQRPGSNALQTAQAIKDAMEQLSKDFPPGLAYRIVYNPSQFIEQSVRAVYETLLEAAMLVVLVILLFLQNWRAALIAIIAIPVSLIGIYGVMAAVGFSLNNLTLFAMVLAIGIVVDDAIVVVENIERDLDRGLTARDAARHTMTEVGTALVSIALVLVAVFIPTAFLGGITGAFFRQFGVTIAGATVISALISLTLSPALGAILLRPSAAPPDRLDRWLARLAAPVFRGFNAGFDAVRRGYGRSVRSVVAHPRMALGVFAALLLATAGLFRIAPTGFIPTQDQGYLIAIVELPKGAALARTRDVVQRATKMVLASPGIAHTVAFAGFSVATGANQTQSGTLFIGLKPYAERGPALGAQAIAGQLNRLFSQLQDAQVIVIAPPPVRGIGTGADFKMMVEDRGGQGLPALEAATWQLAGAAAQSGSAARSFTTFSNNSPEYFIDIDRTRAEMLDVPVENIFETLQVYLGSAYVNDFTLLGRNYRVTAQADAPFRLTPENVARLEARNRSGDMVLLGSVITMRASAGPDRVVRHNSYPTAELQVGAPPGRSSGDVLTAMEDLARSVLPPGFGYDWTELAFQQRRSSGTGLFMFPLSVLFVFLVLAAQYESWSLPFSIVLIVPLCLLFAVTALLLRGMDVNILAQIGFVVLVGLASKNAILIVEFARQKQDAGMDPATAAVEAAEIRLRPILMTSLAFIFGVLPLALASGAAAEMRRALGTVVVGGMLGVTLVGLYLTPVFFVVIRGWLARRQPPAPPPLSAGEPGMEP